MHNFNANATFQGFTAFHYAALLNNIESLKILIDHGADPHLKSVTGHKPIDLVTDLTIYELLADYEKNVDFNVLLSKDIQKPKYPIEFVDLYLLIINIYRHTMAIYLT